MKKYGIFIGFVLIINVCFPSILFGQELEKATFAGGCFWCMEGPFDVVNGVQDTIVGYTGGQTKNPTYRDVTSGNTGHAEAIEVYFDPSVVSYSELLQVFWMNINPTQLNRQFADIGIQYRTAIFYHNEEQQRAAEASKKKISESGKFKRPIVTEITVASTFYKAEEYHQNYYKKNPLHYKLYSVGSGRVGYLDKVWGASRNNK